MPLSFRNLPDDQPIPDDCCGSDGAPDWAALLEWICPDLPPDEAERLAAIGQAEQPALTIPNLRALIERHARP